jgi:hypothetical protein
MSVIKSYVNALLAEAGRIGLSKAELARRAGHERTALRHAMLGGTNKFGPGELNYSIAFIAGIERALAGAGAWLPKLLPSDPVIARRQRAGALSAHKEVVLRPELLGDLDARVAEARRYLGHLAAEHGALRTIDIDRRLLGSIAPDIRCHVFDIGDDAEPSVIARWDAAEGYDHGRDLTGMRLADLADEALRECWREGVGIVARSGLDQLAAIERRLLWSGLPEAADRVVVRWMTVAIGPGDGRQVVVLARLQEADATVEALRGLIAGHPQQGHVHVTAERRPGARVPGCHPARHQRPAL